MIHKNINKKLILFFPGLGKNKLTKEIKFLSLTHFFGKSFNEKTFVGSSLFRKAKICTINESWKIIVG